MEDLRSSSGNSTGKKVSLSGVPRWFKQNLLATGMIAAGLTLACVTVFWLARPARQSGPVRIGVRHFPPYYFAQSGRKPSGLGVDVIEEAAGRLHYPIAWKMLNAGESAESSIQTGDIDIWPSLTVTPARKTSLHLTEPWLESNYFLFSLQEKGFEKIGDLNGKLVSFIPSSFQKMLAQKYLAKMRLQELMTPEEALQSVCRGQADAAFIEARGGQALLLKRPAGCESSAISFLAVEGASLPVAIASSENKAAQANELRAEIGRMAEDGTLDSIIARWSFVMIKETKGIYTLQQAHRKTRLSIYGILFLLAALLVCLWQIYRARIAKREAERASEALISSEERYRSLVENANDIVYTHDLNGILTSLNRAGEALIGMTRQEVLGKSILRILAPKDVRPACRALRASRQGRMGFPSEVDIIASGGRHLTLEVNSQLIHQSSGSAEVQGIARNVTERRTLERQLRQAHKMEAVGKLAGGIAHDFNNLLTVIVGYTEILQGKLAPGSAEVGMIREIRQAADHASSLTAQLLAFGRRQHLQPVVLDLNEVISSIKGMLASVIGAGIDLKTHLDPGIGAVKADPSQIQQAVINLAANARDAMGNGGTLTITTSNRGFEPGDAFRGADVTAGNYSLLSISDTGCGMDKATQSRIFEPFFTTKELGKGTGLGLSTVYGIVKQSGGYVWLDSEPGKGSTFTICLPHTDEPRPSPSQIAGIPSGKGTGTVLLVEDEDGVREMTRACLELYGYRVIEAPHGAEALRIARLHAGSIDLLLTDVIMPFLTGPELAEQIRKIFPGIKVLFMSGYTDRVLADSWGPADFLQKPFTPKALSTKLIALTNRPKI